MTGRTAATALAATTLLAGLAAPAGSRPAASPRVAQADQCVSARVTRTQVRDLVALAQRRLTLADRAEAVGDFPALTDQAGVWQTTTASAWTSGFFPGSLWLAYARTRRPAHLARARAWTRAVAGQAADRSTHDVGFQIMSSFGNGFRLTHRRAYERTIAEAAASLATRYDPDVRAIRSWGRRHDERHFKVIIDNLMNLDLLFWAGRHEQRPRWTRMARQHADTTARHFVRPNGSVIHLVDFDPRTGRVQGTANPQGYDATSTWSRGQAWAVAGFAQAYRWTRRRELLDAARRTAHYFVGHLPADYVPFWDFDAPDIPDAPRDSSAAAIAADGLLELSQVDPNRTRRSRYAHDASAILCSLVHGYLAPAGQATLSGATATFGVEPSGIGTSYGDYYVLDAAERWLRLHRSSE